MDTNEPIRLTTPADVLNAVPYLLGYYPTESLVVMILGDSSLYATARVDLPTDPHASATTLVGLARAAHGQSSVLLIAYSSDESASDTVLAYFGENWPDGVAPIQAMLAANPAGWAVIDQGVEEIGTPRQPYVTDHRVAAEAVSRGLGVANLDEMTEQVMAPVTADDAATLPPSWS